MSTELAPDQKNWLSWRQTGIGSSDAPVIAGVSPFPDQNRIKLWLEKSGTLPRERDENYPQMWGHLFEDGIATRVAQRLNLQYAHAQPCFQSDERPWQLATLDRLTKNNEIVELKTVGFAKMKTLGADGEVESLPQSWLLQAQHQMAVTGFQLVIFGVFVGTTDDARIYHVERNDELIDSLNEVESEFWESVQSKTPPLALGVRDSEALVKHLGVQEGQIELPGDIEAAVDEFNAIKAQISLLEDMKDSTKARIIDSLGGMASGVLPDGRIVKCSVTDIAESVSTRKAHKRINLSFRNARSI